jgi:hypothetical protein
MAAAQYVEMNRLRQLQGEPRAAVGSKIGFVWVRFGFVFAM